MDQPLPASPMLRRAELERRQAAQLVEILRDADKTVEEIRPNPNALANDPERLRGLPAVGRGIGGAIKGSRPDVDGVNRAAGRRVRD